MALVFPQELRAKELPYIEYRAIKFRNRWAIKDNRRGASEVNEDEVRTDTVIASRAIEHMFTVALPLPIDIQNSYKPEWDIEDQRLLNVIRETYSAYQTEGLGEAFTTGAEGISALFLTDMRRRINFKVANPQKQPLFNGIQPRQFSFSHTFTPRSEKESSELENILKKMTASALPVADSQRDFFFGFPNEYQISFRGIGNHNIFPKISYCVCTDVTHNLSGQGMNMLRDGMPVSVNMSLTFTEVDLRISSDPGI